MPLNLPTYKPLTCGLYVVTTPIGNMADITLRALSILATVDLIAAEDTRHTRRLLAAHDIDNHLISYHEHNEKQRTTELIAKLDQGAAIALVSDAGTPTVSDPGYRLVQAATQHQFPVIPIPGVSAAITALSVSGMPTDQFTFIGFPARKKTKRLEQLHNLAALTQPLIFYQSPQRLLPFLQELLAVFGDRPAVLAREMTKLHEEFLRGSLIDIITTLEQRDAIKGECTLLVSGAPEKPAMDEEDIDLAIGKALEQNRQSLKDIAKELAERFKVGKKQIYDRALAIKKEKS